MSIVKSILPATTVSHAIYDHVISSSVKHLVLAKPQLLEFYQINENGLNFVTSLHVRGLVESIVAFSPSTTLQDHDCAPRWLFMTIDRNHCVVVAYIKEAFRVFDEIYRAEYLEASFLETQLSVVDPTNTYIVVQFCQGYVVVLRIQEDSQIAKLIDDQPESDSLESSLTHGQWETKFSLFRGVVLHNLDLVTVVSMAFLEGCKLPTLAILYREPNSLNVAVYTISPQSSKLNHVCEVLDIDTRATKCIPVAHPLGGFMVLGNDVLSYYAPSQALLGSAKSSSAHTMKLYEHHVPFADSEDFTCFDKIDDNRYLIGARSGKMYLLLLEFDLHSLCIKTANLVAIDGNIGAPTGLVHISSSYFFAGSRYSPSTLFKIVIGDSLSVLPIQSIQSLGPIMDTCNIRSSTQMQLVTCSAGSNRGSLRRLSRLRHVQLQAETFTADFVVGLWSWDDDVLVVSTLDKTYCISKSSLTLVKDVPHLQKCRTLALALLTNGRVLQVTEDSACLLNTGIQWSVPNNCRITQAHISDRLVALCIDNKTLQIHSCDDLSLKRMESFSYEMTSVVTYKDLFAVVGLWDGTVTLIPADGSDVCKQRLLKAVPARSLAVLKLHKGAPLALYVGNAEGSLIVIPLNGSRLSEADDHSSISMGDSPLAISIFNGHIITSSDSVSILSWNQASLTSDHLDIEPFQHAVGHGDNLTIWSQGTLQTYSISEEVGLYLKDELNLSGVCEHVLYLPDQNCFVVSSVNGSGYSSNFRVESSDLLVIDQSSFEIISSYKTNEGELITSIEKIESESIGFSGFVVGSQLRSLEGRISLFRLSPSRELIVASQLGVSEVSLTIAAIPETVSGPSCRFLAAVGAHVCEFMVHRVTGHRFELSMLPHKIARSLTLCHKLSMSSTRVAVADLISGATIGVYVPSDRLQNVSSSDVAHISDLALLNDALLVGRRPGVLSYYTIGEEGSRLIWDFSLGERILSINRIEPAILENFSLSGYGTVSVKRPALIGTSTGRLLFLFNIEDETILKRMLCLQRNMALFAKVVNFASEGTDLQGFNMK